MVRRWRWALAATVVLALGLRVAFLVADPHPYEDSGLAAASGEMARQIDHHGRWFASNLVATAQLGDLQNAQHRLIDPASVNFRAADSHPRLQAQILQPVGEAVVLAGLWKVTGEHWLPYQLLLIAIDSAMTLVVFYIGSVLFGRRRTALLGALLYAVFPPIAWLTTIPHTDMWAVDLTIVITALLLRARAAPERVGWLVAAGIAIGLGSYFRPGLLLIPPFVALAASTRPRWRQTLLVAVVPTLVAALLIVPWTVRNANVFHSFIPLRIGVGQNLWEGLGEIHNDFGARLDDAGTFGQVHAVHPQLVYGTPAYDSLLASWARHAIHEHPFFYLELIGKRLVDSTVLLQNTEWGGGTFAKVLEPLLFVLSVLTILATRRRYGRSHLILAAVVVATMLPYLFLHLEARYILPASFAYLLWTSLGADLLLERAGWGTLRSLPDVRHLRHPRDLADVRR
jgi:4-amino-4-deoxy-L-arabinose transferase-like glycosyltransferase